MTNQRDEREVPERIYIHPTSAEYHLNKWPLDEDGYIEYVRTDLASRASVAAVEGDALSAVDHWATLYNRVVADNTELVNRLAEVSKDGDLISRQEAMRVAHDHDKRHDSGYRCCEGEIIAQKIAKLPTRRPDVITAAYQQSRL